MAMVITFELVLFVDSNTNMTMLVRQHFERTFSGVPLVADETDAGKEAPATGLAPESG